jgi:cellulose biosynthesis protein BcsQ
MKQVNLIFKKAALKSLLTWFLANHYSDNNNVLFMDVDESTHVTSRFVFGFDLLHRSLFYLSK